MIFIIDNNRFYRLIVAALVISIITVLLKCAGNVQKVLAQIVSPSFIFKINKSKKNFFLHKNLNNNITNDVRILNDNITDNSLSNNVRNVQIKL